MTTNKHNSLETFVERHRSDFDAHEPRLDLWAALEQELAGPVAAAPVEPTGQLTSGTNASPSPTSGRSWFGRYGIAAALAALVVAAGTSEAWKSKSDSSASATVATTSNAPMATATAPDEALFLSHTPQAITAAERTGGADSQLVRAVRGMENYYTSQLAQRQQELRELQGSSRAGMTADWQRELVSLDSSYRLLKQELPYHPQTDAVLTAMNRNLQIRLDILDQQLHLRTTPRETDLTASTYVLADSRQPK